MTDKPKYEKYKLELLEDKKVLPKKQLLQEMALVVDAGKIRVDVVTKEKGYIPHFLVTSKNKRTKVKIKIEKAEYFELKKSQEDWKLTSDEKNLLNEYLNKQNKEDKYRTNYETTKLLWNILNPKYRVDMDNWQQPDYTELPSKK